MATPTSHMAMSCIPPMTVMRHANSTGNSIFGVVEARLPLIVMTVTTSITLVVDCIEEAVDGFGSHNPHDCPDVVLDDDMDIDEDDMVDVSLSDEEKEQEHMVGLWERVQSNDEESNNDMKPSEK